MGPCKGCGRMIVTWWGPRCWVCTSNYLESVGNELAEKYRAVYEARKAAKYPT